MDEVTSQRPSTADTYQRPLEIEVKSLLSRVGELTSTVGKLFDEVTLLMMRVEEIIGHQEAFGGNLIFQKSEAVELKKMVDIHNRVLHEHETALVEMYSKLNNLSERLNQLQGL